VDGKITAYCILFPLITGSSENQTSNVGTTLEFV
jgi:hypothetical protein